MIIEHGDATLIDPPPAVTILTHCVNNRAIWGSGFVLALDAKWPAAKTTYLRWARMGEPHLLLGQTLFVKVESNLVIANVVGQDGIGRGSLRLPALRQGLEYVALFAERLQAPPRHKRVGIQMPQIGCGIAGGSWDEVGPLVSEVLSRCQVRVRLL